MKNIQVIDGARNCSYAIFKALDEDFEKIFPDEGQDIEFIDDFVARVGEECADEVCGRLWDAPVDKRSVDGIHGTLFYELDFKRKYYPTKRWSEAVTGF